MNTPYQQDIIKPFVDACRKYGMKVGLYFSPEDFWFLHRQGKMIRRQADYAQISNNKALWEYDKKQMKELFTNYGPIDIVFLDGLDNALARNFVHELQPSCIVTRGEMETPEQKVPDKPLKGPRESCFTLGTQWQFKPTNENYKSGGQLIDMLIDIRAKGGNLLINMGPEPSGKVPHEQERRFRELGLWMFVNSEAIHNIRPCPVYKEGDFRFTRSREDESTVYVFIPQGKNPWKRGERREFILKSLSADGDIRISVLGQNDMVVEYDPSANPFSTAKLTGEGLSISVVRAQRLYNDHKWPNPMVVKLEGVKFVSTQ
jgi:alpha-L-fucosidase